jgi:hypothetical protein
MALSTFKASLKALNIGTKIFYLKHELYTKAQELYYKPNVAVNWIAYRAAFGSQPVQTDQAQDFRPKFEYIYLRSLLEAHVVEVASRDWSDCRIFAFSANIYKQTYPALAYARALKKKYPRSLIVFGGTEMFLESGVEYLQKLDWIDVVFLRDAIRTFPIFVANYLQSNDLNLALQNIEGVAYRYNNDIKVYMPSSMYEDINMAPVPDFDDWLEIAPLIDHDIFYPLQFSTGCWYGVKKSCSFCGEGPLRQNCYSARTPENALTYLKAVTTKYPQISAYEIVDPLLPKNYIESVLKPWISIRPRKNDFALCVTPLLTKSQMQTLKELGVSDLTAGIEALHSQVLLQMNKIHKVYHAIAFLKWSKYFQIYICWMLLGRMPGENPEWYDEQRHLISKLVHFNPPICVNPIAIYRYNAYFRPDLQPGTSPTFFPTHIDTNKTSYFWRTNEPSNCKEFDEYADWVTKNWIEKASPAMALTLCQHHVMDTRTTPVEIPITALERKILISCDAPQTIRSLNKRFGEIQDCLNELDKKGLIYQDQRVCISLLDALPENT